MIGMINMNINYQNDSLKLKEYILQRGGVLESEEILYVIDINLHPQINHISFNSGINEYTMWDFEGMEFKFIALNYGEKREDYYKRSLSKN